jgi:hypothetical protein
LYALKTVRQVTTKLEHSTTPVKLALSENLTIYGIYLNAKRGQNAPVVSISLSTAQASPTVHAAAALAGNIRPSAMLMPALIGHIVQQVSTSQPTARAPPTAHA